MPQLKKIDLLPIIAILIFILWYAVPSSLFLKPVSWSLQGTDVRFVRLTPLGSVTAKWETEISLLNRNGFECHGSGTAHFQEIETNTVVYEIGSWALRCINAGPPFTIRQTWQVVLFDFIPLRSTETITVIEGTERDYRPAIPAIPAITE